MKNLTSRGMDMDTVTFYILLWIFAGHIASCWSDTSRVTNSFPRTTHGDAFWRRALIPLLGLFLLIGEFLWWFMAIKSLAEKRQKDKMDENAVNKLFPPKR